MTRNISRSLALIGLGLTLTACAQYNPAQSNCFNFRDSTPRAATTTVSTMGAEVTRRDTECDFVMLGAGN